MPMTMIFYKNKPIFTEASGMKKEPLLLLFKMLKAGLGDTKVRMGKT